MNESRIENNQIKEYEINFENENAVLKTKLSELTLENTQIQELKDELFKLKEEKRSFDKALTASTK